MLVHANIATVASFAPIGEYAGWYRSHMGDGPVGDTAPHASPMAEVLSYHGERWAHVERYDDFVPFLTYHHFDADEQVELAVEAGMRSLVHVAKHHDGFCWWDAPGTDRTSVLQGPRRNVLAELAAAARRRDVLFGTAYSLLDWGDVRPRDRDSVDDVLHRHVLDLVERYGSQMLWGDGHWDQEDDVRRTDELIERCRDLADAQGYELVVNDRWHLPEPDVTTFEYTTPDDIDLRPWQLSRGLGHSFGNNRAERSEHVLSTGGLLDLLTEVIAKGGNLQISVGPGVDGAIPELQRRPLREVGAWVTAHADVVHGSRPFDQWGDAQVRYVRVGADVLAVDLAAGVEITLAGLTPDRYEVQSIEADDGAALHWEQHRGGVGITRIDRSPTGLAGLYRISLRDAPQAIRLFDEHSGRPKPLQELLDAASAGDIVQLRDGVHQGPVRVPDGVTLRGLGWDRSSIVGTGLPGAVVTLGASASVEALHVLGAAARIEREPVATVAIAGERSSVIGCRVDGHVIVLADDASVQAVIGLGVVADGRDRLTVERCAFRGMRWDVGIDVDGGSSHRISRNEAVDHLCAIRLTDASAALVAENRLEARWWGVHLVRCDHVEAVDNTVQHTMRAVDVEGGNGSVVTGNWVADGDSGALVEYGATDTAVIDNHVERCRIGVLVWDAPTTRIGPNTFVDLHEDEPVVHGPDADSD